MGASGVGAIRVDVCWLWGDQIVDIQHWRTRRGSVHTVAAPSRHMPLRIELRWDGRGVLQVGVFENRKDGPALHSERLRLGSSTTVDVAARERGPFRSAQAGGNAPFRARIEVQADASRRPVLALRPSQGLLVSLFGHCAFLALMSLWTPSLRAEPGIPPSDRRGATQTREPRLVQVLVPIRLVHTQTAPTSLSDECPLEYGNCEAFSPEALGAVGQPWNPSVLRRTAARLGISWTWGSAFFNWTDRAATSLQPTGMPVVHKVRAGETLTSIAKSHGLGSWECLYRFDANPEFVALRSNPHRIKPGDTVLIPQLCSRGEAAGYSSIGLHPWVVSEAWIGPSSEDRDAVSLSQVAMRLW